jgi:hypothetical protein
MKNILTVGLLVLLTKYIVVTLPDAERGGVELRVKVCV